MGYDAADDMAITKKSGAHIVANDIYPVVEDGAVVVHLVETKVVSRQGGDIHQRW